MTFIKLTRPDGAAIYVNAGEIVSFAPALPGTGPLDKATRLLFRNNGHQDVTETIEAVARLVGALPASR